ncbi:MAG: AAA family ATPase, partial [Chloroflexota bacterium]
MPPRYAPYDIVDSPLVRSVESSSPEARRTVRGERPPIAVGPGRPIAIATPRSGLLRDQGTTFPIQIAKVQRPALRDETLERPRLLDWLRAKINGRVVLLLADAGYGKTTLLADFSRRIRQRTLWYRLDETDRDWTSFLQHLVAAGREHDPGFAPATASLLGEIGVAGPSREAVLDTFIRELPSIAVGGAILVFDDFHLVDDATDVRHIARELVARAPERLTIVFASRRSPTVPLSRLRAVGEVAELTTDDLRFDVAETRQLFTETFGRNLDADVLEDLAHRTEGWIASLQLVQAALRDRSPAEIRRFVRSLHGSDHEMYDYLAEEVVGDLSQELQRFLMDTSILQVVTPELAEVVSGQDAGGIARLTTAAERLTLLSRLSGAPRTHLRYHPLVREFLEARFRSIDGDESVAALHRRTAEATAASDWRMAAHHYREAGDTAAMLGIVNEAIPTIMGNGQYALAEAFVTQVPPEVRPPGFDLILSRIEMQRGDYDAAITASQAVLDATDDPVQRDYA